MEQKMPTNHGAFSFKSLFFTKLAQYLRKTNHYAGILASPNTCTGPLDFFFPLFNPGQAALPI